MRIFKYLKKYWVYALLAPIFMLFEVLVDLLQPTLLSSIVDNGVLAGNMSLIIKTGVTMLILVIFGGIMGALSSFAAGIASQSFSCDLRKAVYSKIMNLSFQQTDKFTTGSLVTRLTNDITQTQDFVATALRMFVRSSFMFIGGIIMMMRLNVDFGRVLAFSLPIQIVIVIIFLRKTSPLFSVVQTKLDRVNSVMQENVSGSRVVKAYVNEEYETERFGTANNELMGINLKVQKLMATIAPMLMIIMNISVVAIIYIGGLSVQASQMQAGKIMAAITYTTQIIMSMMMVSMMFQMVSRAKASMDRINEVLTNDPVIKNGHITEAKGNGSISFENVSFGYPNVEGKPILKDISLNIKSGETLAILGATGSGKSSFVNLIPRFYDVTNGEIQIDGVDVKDYDLETLRSKISFVLQKSELFSGTVAENIRWGNDNATMDDIIEAAKTAQAHDFIMSFNDEYNTVIAEKGSSLSGGQKQRVCIARAIIRKPEILIFDDSTSALDLSTEANLHQSLKENLKGTTFIMVAQRVASVKNVDKIIVLDNGHIAAYGTHDELLANSEIYQDIYNSQVKKEDQNNEQ